MDAPRPQSFEEFWPHYVKAHRTPTCRALHYVGTSTALLLLCAAAATQNAWMLLAAPVVGYACAWIGHFVFEKNRPATFGNFWWSLRGDFRMLSLGLRGRMKGEIERVH